MRSLSREISSLISFLVELVIYAGFVTGYFFLVLHFLGDWIDKIFNHSKIQYAFLSLSLIVVQGVVLERLTTMVMWVIVRVQASFAAVKLLARPQETVTRPKNAPGLLVYRFAGPLLAVNTDFFSRRVQELIDEADPPVSLFLVNAEAMISMDTTAVETLDELHNTLKKKDIELGFCEVKGHFREVLMNTPLHRRVGFNVYPSVADVIQHLTQKPHKEPKTPNQKPENGKQKKENGI